MAKAANPTEAAGKGSVGVATPPGHDEVKTEDLLLSLRDAEIPDVSHLTKAPSTFRPLVHDEMSRLKKIGDANMAEAEKALEEVAANIEGYRANIGTKPNPAIAPRLVARRAAASKAVAYYRRQLAYFSALEDMVNHESATFLNEATKDLNRAVEKDAGVADQFPMLGKYSAAVSQAIADGIAQSKALKAAEAKGSTDKK